MFKHRRAELVEAAVGQFQVRLDTDGGRDVASGGAIGQVPQQSTLADARLAPQDGDTASTGERIGQKTIERVALPGTPEKPRGPTAILARRGPPSAVNDAQ